ncbi:hypothetical protein EJ06DRAFT_527604, partial [Trichodelitschia bisporula]
MNGNANLAALINKTTAAIATIGLATATAQVDLGPTIAKCFEYPGPHVDPDLYNPNTFNPGHRTKYHLPKEQRHVQPNQWHKKQSTDKNYGTGKQAYSQKPTAQDSEVWIYANDPSAATINDVKPSTR